MATKAQDTYDIEILLDNNRVFDIDVNQVGFKLRTSIWQTLPTAEFYFQDSTSLIQEFLLTVPATGVNITFGYQDTNWNLPFIIRRDFLSESENPQLVSGVVTVPLIHKWAFQQNPKLDSYDDTVSGVIETITSNFKGLNEQPFSKFNIKTTQESNFWYQSLMNDIEFIEEVLLPRALGADSKQTPYFSFINGLNEYNFTHYKAMSEDSNLTTLEYKDASEKNYSRDVISFMSRRRKDFLENKKYLKKVIYNLDEQTGQIETDEDTIDKYSLKSFGDKLPLKTDSEITSYLYLGKNDDPIEDQAQRIFKQRNAISQDQLLLLAPFNPKLQAGKTIDIKVYTTTGKQDDAQVVSQFSGKYLIEDCEAIWDGFNSTALTKLIVSRQYNKYTDNYVLKSTLQG